MALRQGRRWVQAFQPVRLAPPAPERLRLREGGTYLVTGGLGEIGLDVAELFTRTVRARLVLVGRSGLPERTGWDAWIAGHGEDQTRRRIERVRALEAAGAQVLVAGVDAADLPRMLRVRRSGPRRRLASVGSTGSSTRQGSPGAAHSLRYSTWGARSAWSSSGPRRSARACGGAASGPRAGLRGPDVVAVGGAGRHQDGRLRGGQPVPGRPCAPEAEDRTPGLDERQLGRVAAAGRGEAPAGRGRPRRHGAHSRGRDGRLRADPGHAADEPDPWSDRRPAGALRPLGEARVAGRQAGRRAAAGLPAPQARAGDALRGARATRPSARSRTRGRRCSASRGSGLATTSSTSEATRSSPPRSSLGCARATGWRCRSGPSSRRPPSPASPARSSASGERERSRQAPPILRAPAAQGPELSFAQQRLWFFDQLEPHSSAYNLCLSLRHRGDLSVSALERSFREIVRRHEVLRTTLATVDGRPAPRIASEALVSLPVVDLAAIPEAEREAEARAWPARRPGFRSTSPRGRC